MAQRKEANPPVMALANTGIDDMPATPGMGYMNRHSDVGSQRGAADGVTALRSIVFDVVQPLVEETMNVFVIQGVVHVTTFSPQLDQAHLTQGAQLVRDG